MYSGSQNVASEQPTDHQGDHYKYDRERRESGNINSSSNSSRSRSSSTSRSISSNNSSNHILTMGYHRSSSSSTASSGKNLVKSDPAQSHFDLGYHPRDVRYNHYHMGSALKGNGLSSSSPSPSPEMHKKPPPKFFLGPPSATASLRGYHTPLRSSPSPSPEMPSTPHPDTRLKQPQLLHPNYNLAELQPQHLLTPPNKGTKISSLYDAYWHIPRASLWCSHKDCGVQNQKCSKCQLKEETSSTCSSLNPPPTFTAMDNYHPIRKRPSKCSCGAIFAATTIFSTLVLVLIAAFIIYVEMVLKRAEYIPDPM